MAPTHSQTDIRDPALSRRSALHRGSAVAVAGALALGLGLPKLAAAQVNPAERAFGRVLGLERILAVSLRYLNETELPDGPTARTLGRLASQTDRRIELTRPMVGNAEALGRPSAAEVPGLVGQTDREALLSLVLGLESQVYTGYLDAIGATADPEDLRLAGGLAAGVAQHLSILRRELGEDPAPRPLESGAGV